VDDLQNFIADRELEKLRTLVHQLKGAGSGYGFPAITHTAANTEAVIKNHAAFDTVQAEVNKLIALIRSTAGYDPTREQQPTPNNKNRK
jgi:HPt (histidine-containing phosphotransfer) domain-containing protein